MKKKYITIAVVALCTFWNPFRVNSQEETVETSCRDYFKAPFVATGQPFKALLTGEEVAEFHTSFFAGTTYRIVACQSGENNLIFSVYDSKRNLIFSNKSHENAAYWDFNVLGSLDCIVEARLDPAKKTSGMAMLMVGFKATQP